MEVGRVSAAGEAKTREGRRRATEQRPTRNGRALASGSKEGALRDGDGCLRHRFFRLRLKQHGEQ